MAGGSKDLRYNVAVDASDASASLKKLSSDVKKTAKDIEGSFDDSASAGDKFKATVDELSSKLSTEFTAAAAAADKLGTALKDAGSKMDVADAISDLTRMGFTFDEITADADKFATSLKQLDDVKIEGVKQLDSVAPGLATKLDQVEKSADSSKGALANMVGNSAQDLGALGGIAGSTGVLIGQMAEYMADAAFEGEGFASVVKNFAAVAGPAAALGVVIATVTGFMEKQAEGAKVAAERNKELGKAMEGAADDAVGIADALKGNLDPLRDFDAGMALLGSSSVKTVNDLGRSIPLVGRIFEDTSRDIVDALSDGQSSIYDFSKAVTGSEDDAFAFILQMRTMASLGAITEDQFTAISGAVDDYRASVAKAEQAQALLNVHAEDANAIFGEIVTKADPMSKFADVWATLVDDMADGAINTEQAAEAVNFLADKLGLTREEVISLGKEKLDERMEKTGEAFEKTADDLREWTDQTAKAIARAREFEVVMSSASWGKAALDGAVSAMSEYTEQQFGLVDIAADAEAAFDDLSASVEKNGKTFDVTTEKGRANQSALEEVAKTLDTKLAAAYVNADGDLNTFKTSAGVLATETLTRLQTELGLSDDETRALGESLGLTEGDYEARFKLSGAAEAQAKLDLLNISLDDFDDPNARQAYMEAIVQGDYVKALDLARVMAQGDKNVRYKVTIDTFRNDRGNTFPVPPEIGATGGTAGRGGMLVAETGEPEIVRRPGRRRPELITTPTIVPPGTKVTSVRATRRFLRGRDPKSYANGTMPAAITHAGGMTFVFEQNAPVYGVADLDRHLALWSQRLAQQISVGRRN